MTNGICRTPWKNHSSQRSKETVWTGQEVRCGGDVMGRARVCPEDLIPSPLPSAQLKKKGQKGREKQEVPSSLPPRLEAQLPIKRQLKLPRILVAACACLPTGEALLTAPRLLSVYYMNLSTATSSPSLCVVIERNTVPFWTLFPEIRSSDRNEWGAIASSGHLRVHPRSCQDVPVVPFAGTVGYRYFVKIIYGWSLYSIVFWNWDYGQLKWHGVNNEIGWGPRLAWGTEGWVQQGARSCHFLPLGLCSSHWLPNLGLCLCP